MKFVLLAILAGRFLLVINRYIDTDEFAHLHWAYLVSQGLVPYRDFFINFVPAYHLFLLPLFLLPQTSTLVIVARVWEFVFFLALVFLIYRMTKDLTGKHVPGLLAACIFVAFPMTLDKTLELRPDVLMTFLALAGIVLCYRHAFLSGFLVGLSFLILQKIIFIIPVFFYIFFSKKMKPLPFLVGLLIPLVIFVLFLMSHRLQNLALINILRGSQGIKAGEGIFSPLLSLSPWPLVYVSAGGLTIPWLVNTALWILAAIGIFFAWQQFLLFAKIGLIFLSSGIVLLFVTPTPFLQYFIPLTVFGSIFAAVAINKVGNTFTTGLFLLALSISFLQQFQDRIVNTNSEQLQVIDNVLKISAPNDTFYDMVGSYVFRPDGYYICCNVYSQFADSLGLPLPTLRDALIANNTKFLILDRTGQSLWLPKKEDLEFLQKKYKPSQYPKIYIRID